MSFLRRLFGSRPLPGQLTQGDGFVDIDLPLTSIEASQGATRIECRGTINESVVALAIRLDPDWNPQQLEDSDLVVHWGTGALITMGTESNNLVSVLALCYGLNSISERSMLSSIPYQVVCLGGDPTLSQRGMSE
jgi:hypothetical protein